MISQVVDTEILVPDFELDRTQIGTRAILRYLIEQCHETNVGNSLPVLCEGDLENCSQFQKTTIIFPYQSSIPFIFPSVNWFASDRSFLRQFRAR